MTVSTGVPNKWSDQQEFVDNGTIQSWFNDQWQSAFARAGVLDLKAPDELYRGSHFLWNPTPTIPPRAIIKSASFAGAASHTVAGVVTTGIEVVDKDGSWNVRPTKAAHWKAGVPGGTYQAHCEVHVFAGAVEIAATGAVAGALSPPWECRRWGVVESPATARGYKLGEVLTIATGGTLTSASIRASKVGAPSGNVWLEVWSISGGLPSALLATSDTRLASSIAVPAFPDALEVFTFSGINQIAQTLGVQYAYVLTGSWAVTFNDYIQARVTTGFTSGADRFAVVYGESRGLDWGNYISGGRLLVLPVIAGSPTVVWSPPNFTVGTVYTTPDISALIQAWVNAPTYVAGEPVLIRWRPTNPAQLFSRGFKTWIHADTPGVSPEITLTIGWRRRRMGVT